MKNSILVTVIITAHNRKDFLIEAINSVLNQNFVNEECQIIVVKNFIDLRIDEFLCSKGVLSLYCESSDLGSKIEHSLQFVKGRIIYFLDDDDTFEPDKIHILTSHFLNYPEIFFIHNNQNVIDHEGKRIMNPKRKPYNTSFNILNLNELNKKYIVRKILSKKLTFNLSSIAIRLEVLVKLKNFLSVATLRTDFVSFVSVIEDENFIGYTDFPFTNYRIHESNLSKLEIGNKRSYKFLLNSINNLQQIKYHSENSVTITLCDFFINDAWLKLNLFYEKLTNIKDYDISMKKLLIEVFLTHQYQNISFYLAIKFLKKRRHLFFIAIKTYRIFI
jgi:glycosyltransferase involved in cell wall biosynthesis